MMVAITEIIKLVSYDIVKSLQLIRVLRVPAGFIYEYFTFKRFVVTWQEW